MSVKLIAIDIDGTLLDSRYQLSEANRKAVVEATARGIEVALVTGRRFDFARPIALQFECPLTMIVNNGALVKSKDGATHLRHLLPRNVARGLLEGRDPGGRVAPARLRPRRGDGHRRQSQRPRDAYLRRASCCDGQRRRRIEESRLAADSEQRRKRRRRRH